jgi:hypothetical protein
MRCFGYSEREKGRTSRFVLAGVICATAITGGCAVPFPSYQTTGTYGDNVNGRSVERLIDTKLAPLLKSSDPTLLIGRARCAGRLDVSKGKTAYCSLPVNDVDLPVSLYLGTQLQGAKISLDGVFDVPLSDSDLDEGAARVARPARVSPTSRRFLADALAMHDRGERVILTGSDVDAYLDRFYLSTLHANRPGTVACPQSVDLSGENHVICAIQWQGNLTQHIDIFLLGDNYTVLRQEAIVDRPRVSQTVEASLNRQSVDRGDPADAKVDCGPGLKVVAVNGRFSCPATANGDSFTIIFTVENADGLVNWYVLRN